MIARDQPSVFGQGLVVAVSSRDDGTMHDRTLSNYDYAGIIENRSKFCASAGVDYKTCIYQKILYGNDQTYDKIEEVDASCNDLVEADVLFTKVPSIGLFLPVADCVATVIYDPDKRYLALAHLGRHSSIAKTMTKTLNYFLEQGSEMRTIQIWMAPSVARSSYRMEYFGYTFDPDWRDFCDVRPDGVYLDLAGYNTNLAIQAGVVPEAIVRSYVNTAHDKNYFSHSMGDTTGRFAVVAMMR